jgi:GT2 family glycosyltransferase
LWQEFLIVSSLGRRIVRRSYPSFGPQTTAGPCQVDWVTGACMLLRSDAFRAVDGFDPQYFLYGEEMDLCYRLQRAGWQVWYHPQAVALHHLGGSQSSRIVHTEALVHHGVVRFCRKHYSRSTGALMSGEILAMTALKSVVHGVLRFVTQGRRGRPVVALSELRRQLRDGASSYRSS